MSDLENIPNYDFCLIGLFIMLGLVRQPYLSIPLNEEPNYDDYLEGLFITLGLVRQPPL
jgi:hypothetical protein